MERLRIQQEQTLGTLDTKIDAMMERRTQAIMDRLDGLLGSKSWARDGESNSVRPCREPRVNFNDQQNRRRTYGSTRGRGSSSGYATGDNRIWGPNIRGSTTGNRHTSNERPTQGTHATGRGVSRNRSHASPGRSNASQGRNNPSDSDGREVPSIQPLTGLWIHSLGGYLEPMNIAKSPKGFLRNQDATKTNLIAVLIPG